MSPSLSSSSFFQGGIVRRSYFLVAGIMVQLSTYGRLGPSLPSLCFESHTSQVRATWIRSKRYFVPWELRQRRSGRYVHLTRHGDMVLLIIRQGHTKLPDYVPVGQFPKTPLRDLFTAANADTLNLLSKCLIYEPRKRLTAREVHFLPSYTCDGSDSTWSSGSLSPIFYWFTLSYTSLQTPKVYHTTTVITGFGRNGRKCRNDCLWSWCQSQQQSTQAEADLSRRSNTRHRPPP